MSNKAAELIPFGSQEFWDFYDEFCADESLRRLVDNPNYLDAVKMGEITRAAHLARQIHKLRRPNRGWDHHHAWLALRNAEIQRPDGELSGLSIRPGDVVVVEHGWDRDVIITHCPIIRNMVSGYLLSGKWEPMVGLFLPLFDKATILTCVEIRIRKNAEEAVALVHEEARDWGWPHS